MNARKNLFFLIVIVVMATINVSCNNKKISDELPKNVINVEQIDISKIKSIPKNIFSKQEYTILSTNNNTLIGNIDKLIVLDKYFIILDSRITRSVYCYTKTGKLNFVISNFGTGKGEYESLEDVSFDDRTNELLLYCSKRSRILFYNMNGEYLKEAPIQLFTSRIEKDGENYVLYNDYKWYYNKNSKTYCSNILILDDVKRNIVNEAAQYKAPLKRSVVWTSKPQFSKFDDTLSIKPDHSNIIYHVSNGSIIPAYYLNFGDNNIDKEYWNKAMDKNMNFNEFIEFSIANNYCIPLRFMESKTHMFFVYKKGNNVFKYIHSKIDNKGYNIYGNILIENVDVLSIDKNVLYCSIDPNKILSVNKIAKGLFPTKIVGSTTELSNPIIIALTIK